MIHKLLLAFAILLFVLYEWVVWVSFYPDKDHRETKEEKFVHALQQKNKQHPETIDLSKLTSFQWDEVYLFQGYTRYQSINKELGYTYFENADATGILSIGEEVRELHTMFLFVKNNKVISEVEVPNYDINFSLNMYDLKLKREKAFFIRYETDGETYFLAKKKGNCTAMPVCKDYKEQFK